MRVLLELLVRLFPPGFRDRFGPDVEEQIRTDFDRAAARGRRHAALFAAATAADLLRSAVAERLNPSWAETHDPSTYEHGVGTTMSGWRQDLGHAARALRRAPGFTAVAVVTLGLAIGANAGIFSVIDTILLDPLPFADADRLVYIGASAPGSDLPEEFGVSAEFYVQYAEESELLEDLAAFNSFTNTLRVGDRAERVPMSSPTMSLFTTLGASPVLGRLPTPDEEGRVVLISHRLWTTWFDRDPSIVGKTIWAGGDDRTVIGVMGPDFWFPNDDVLLWIPHELAAADVTSTGRFGLPLIGRVTPGTTPEALAAELNRLALRLPERFGGSANYARMIEQHRAIVRPGEEQLLGDISRPLWLLLGAVAIVLMIACANVANLFTVRAEHRQRDLAVRRALGAARRELIRSQMAEALVVAGLAGGMALLLAWLTVPLLVQAAPPDIPRLDSVSVTGLTLLFTGAASVVAALACGFLPAVRASAPELARLRDGGRGSTGRRHWGRDGLVAGQTALALVLLIGSGLLLRSFVALRNVDPGYDVQDVFTFQMAPEAEHLVDGPSWARFHLDFMDRVAALPGVESVGIVENVPLNEGVSGGRFLTEATAADPEGGALVYYTWSGGDYFGTMGIDVLRGRPFARSDHVSDLGHVVVSRSAAELLWPGEDAVGQRLQQRGEEAWHTVVGVVDDVLQYGYRSSPQPMVYFPLTGPTPDAWRLPSPAYVVKTERADAIAPEIRAMVAQVAPGAPMYRVFTMEGLASDSMVQLTFTMLTLAIAASLALILGAIGLFGVLSYVVAERTREIGLRMALGAEASGVRRMVVAQGARVVLLGIVLGVVGSLLATRALGSLLYGVGSMDATTFVVMSAAMVGVGLLASYLPARRASSVDPIESLRGE